MVPPDILGTNVGHADALLPRASIPRFTDAEAIHVADFHVLDHLRWRDGNDLDCSLIDTGRREPIAQPQIVRPAWKGHRKSNCLLSFEGVDRRPQLVDIAETNLLAKIVRERNGLAVVVQDHRNVHFPAGLASDAGVNGERHAEQTMGPVQIAGQHFVADRRPRSFSRYFDVYAVLPIEPEFVSHHNRCAISQRNKTDLYLCLRTRAS